MKSFNSFNWIPYGLSIVIAGTGISIAALFLKDKARKDFLAMIDRILRRDDHNDTYTKDNDKDTKKPSILSSSSEKSYNAESYAESLTDITSESLGVAHLYKSYQAAAIVIKLYIRLLSDGSISEQEREAIDAFMALLRRVERNGACMHRIASKIKLIAIEGLKHSGKTKLINTIVPKLPSRYRAVVMPKEYDDVDEFFTAAPESIAKAFNCLRNYIISNQIYEDFEANPLDDRHYFIDGFYHTTCASTIMSQVDAPDDQAHVAVASYEWPLDLPVPNMVVFLHVPTEIRLRRFDQEAAVACERSLRRSIVRDEKAQLAYSLMKGPLTIAIDANTYPAEVCDVTIEALGEYGFIIPKSSNISSPSNKRSSVGVYGALNQLP